MDTSGFTSVVEHLPRWKPDSTLEELSRIWSDVATRNIAEIDSALSKPAVSSSDRFMLLMTKAMFLNYQGEPRLPTSFSSRRGPGSRARMRLPKRLFIR